MFSIAPENSRHNGYYSEKLVDCFVAKTIPLYWGAPDIGKHFNEDGVISFNNGENLMAHLKALTPSFYESRVRIVHQNFNTAMKSVHQWDLIDKYITEAIEKKHREGNQRVDSSVEQVKTVENVRKGPYRPLRRQVA